jgi:hypothetical protein
MVPQVWAAMLALDLQQRRAVRSGAPLLPNADLKALLADPFVMHIAGATCAALHHGRLACMCQIPRPKSVRAPASSVVLVRAKTTSCRSQQTAESAAAVSASDLRFCILLTQRRRRTRRPRPRTPPSATRWS